MRDRAVALLDPFEVRLRLPAQQHAQRLVLRRNALAIKLVVDDLADVRERVDAAILHAHGRRDHDRQRIRRLEIPSELVRIVRAILRVDLDVVDPGMAPGTGTPESGGLLARELLRAVRQIVGAVDLAGMDVVEVSPPYDTSEITAILAHRVVMEAITALAAKRA